MRNQLNVSNNFHIKKFFKRHKLFYLVFFNFKKQKSNIYFKQNLSKLEFNIIRFKNRFLKKTFLFSIYNNFIILIESFIFFGFNKDKNFNFLLLIQNKITKLTLFAIVFENVIYLKKQLRKLKNISFLYNIFRFYIFIIKNVILKLYLLLFSISK